MRLDELARGRLRDALLGEAERAEAEEAPRHGAARARFIAGLREVRSHEGHAVGRTRLGWRWASWTRPLAWGGALALCLVFGGLAVWPQAPSLGFRVGPSAEVGSLGQWLRAAPTQDLAVVFDDGSRIVLGPSSTGRVDEAAADGARLVLEGGRAQAWIVPRPHAPLAWRLDAGPYAVHVTGTVFTTTWTPASEQLDVAVTEGAVRVEGPLLDEGRTVSAGERLSVSLPTRTALTMPLETTTDVGGVPHETATAGGPGLPSAEGVAAEGGAGKQPSSVAEIAEAKAARLEPRVGRDGGRTGRSAAANPRDDAPEWLELARSERWTLALTRAEAEGFPKLLANLDAERLMTLADVARFAGRSDQARRVLETVRSRFKGRPEGKTAAFTLGRLALESFDAPAEALRWLETYLAEDPNGPLAREAAGRCLEAARALGDSARGRDAARRYLDRYPTGPHASLARRTLADP